MRTQEQFTTDEDRSKRIRHAVRDAAFVMFIWIGSLLASAAIAWLYFNGDKVDNHINHLIR